MEWIILLLGLAVGYAVGRWGIVNVFKRHQGHVSLRKRRAGPAKVFMDVQMSTMDTEPDLGTVAYEQVNHQEPQILASAHPSSAAVQEEPSTIVRSEEETALLKSLGLDSANIIEPMQTKALEPEETTPVQSTTPIAEASTEEPEPLTGTLFIGVFAKKHGQKFNGHEIMQVVTSHGLIYGEGALFHYYDSDHNIRFSLAAATKKGTFDLDTLGGFTCPGLILFMDLEQANDARLDFDTMLAVGRKLAEDLEGKLVDQYREPLTLDKVQKIYQQLVLPA